ncbi:MAG: hypothetical protein ACYDDT_03265 [Sulfuricella sp.]
MSNKMSRIFRRPVVMLPLTLLGALSVNWLASGLNGDCLWKPLLGACDSACSSWGRTIFSFFMAISAMSGLWIAARDILIPRHLRPSKIPCPRKVLIAAVSSLGQPVKAKENGGLVIPWDNCENELKLVGDLEQDIKNIAEAHKNGAW